ncbi:uncharacterized protein STEHIDRAFT_116624 [Stereum hirsutum FP-91666 SS1]|uniref:Uncharacterized protein n=1 Tax=Stereum hirsutum (strain FP-91666) TaxID=721885 RepID=R7RVT3_STEHR|nr:uncharacterized protein STEHIDRAFT_116624 [Stereum hirsutum FP-91666 SS1]EIM79274.1 hypothetical protein STEHIDRAFT_116624 [Stereum hirsutum FP-91666 SS1]
MTHFTFTRHFSSTFKGLDHLFYHGGWGGIAGAYWEFPGTETGIYFPSSTFSFDLSDTYISVFCTRGLAQDSSLHFGIDEIDAGSNFVKALSEDAKHYQVFD